MANGGCYLITREIRRGSCHRFSPPQSARCLFDPKTEIAVMLGPEENEIQVSVGKDTCKKMGEIIKKAATEPHIKVKEITSPEAPDLLGEMVADSERILKEPSLEAALRDLIKAKFELIVSQG